MAFPDRNAGLLSPYRVLDLSNELGFLCGKILGDLGADVIKIEPPGGEPARRLGPFYGDQPDPEKSLFWFGFNNNKRGITLNLESAKGRELFSQLVAKADFVMETFTPGYLDGLNLGYTTMSKINPRLVLTSITPFGQTGPYSKFKASDIEIMALSGCMSLTGDPDRPPLRVTFPQSYGWTGSYAAMGALIAHYHREQTGEGQQVERLGAGLFVVGLFPCPYILGSQPPRGKTRRLIYDRAEYYRGKDEGFLALPRRLPQLHHLRWGGRTANQSGAGRVDGQQRHGAGFSETERLENL